MTSALFTFVPSFWGFGDKFGDKFWNTTGALPSGVFKGAGAMLLPRPYPNMGTHKQRRWARLSQRYWEVFAV